MLILANYKFIVFGGAGNIKAKNFLIMWSIKLRGQL